VVVEKNGPLSERFFDKRYKPTGGLHIGNYLGMIKPAFELAEKYHALYFIADYHVLTIVKDSKKLNSGLAYSVIKKELFELLKD
jgi:tryptophanyl-tRNA synthetase